MSHDRVIPGGARHPSADTPTQPAPGAPCAASVPALAPPALGTQPRGSTEAPLPSTANQRNW